MNEQYDLKVTSIAKEKIKEHLDSAKDDCEFPLGFRLAVAGGGCSGFRYEMALEEMESERDIDYNFEIDGIPFLVDMMSWNYIEGATLDFNDSLLQSGFMIKDNPNASSTCGCGESFSI
ncbi:hypothetical protein EN12_19385 [Vibrio cholerae]|uniref:Iron-sulfur cluster assembly accessory protein n=1 Tax=Vibrio cholerae TaxID=666 RepID=A0A5B1C5E0_VIBCL|nr:MULTISPECIES: iron-sulfur cluster assembly accessory protein [Vibrio]AKO77337.1 hypothetical protein EN12_19385 [Vibrio cholerae]KAA1254664.1 iron-sulfur cluster assembly accessory protein [Vibrio cholerae]MCX8796257.1 iron-sulfur cluster assembly accessory protein [Vibrio parahaemolyticus]